jgi:DNA-binding beta-propeller fold protein YncE
MTAIHWSMRHNRTLLLGAILLFGPPGCGQDDAARCGAGVACDEIAGAQTARPVDPPTAAIIEQRRTASYTLFESGQVRPLARSPGGQRLFAVNTPDGRLEIFDIAGARLEHVDSVPVGMEPVAVAARNDHEVWVVNHLSDSVSIVDVAARPARVVRTLLVGDEPRDIVFAGPGRRRAFVTTAHRGQNSPRDPQLMTPGVGRADVWVFDAEAAVDSDTAGGEALAILQLFTDTPRALAVSPDGARVYAAGFLTGNRTTVVPDEVVAANGGLPPPTTNFQGLPQPSTGLIVKFDAGHWRDELGRMWDQFVKFSLPDKDVFVIDATADPPRQLPGDRGFYAGVGTVLFNMAVNPRTGKVYVANTDARNEVRFEGSSATPHLGVQGHLHESRITVLDDSGVHPRHLNKHIDYTRCCAPVPNTENARSLAMPTGMAVTRDGKTLYVAALGSSKVGVFSTAELENDSFVPSEASQIRLSGGGPTGLVLDEARDRMYVLTRFNNAIAVVDLKRRVEVASVAMFTPEPAHIVRGRRLLYDAALTSSHGDSACASCHVFGDLDALGWDLGNPGETTETNPGPFALTPAMVGMDADVNFSPLKGPMATQSLRGLANHGPMHWRGDRTGGNAAASQQPDSGTFDEVAAFTAFNPAFVTLLGRNQPLSAEDMQALTRFSFEIAYPPNPIRNLDNSLTPGQQAGRDFYFNHVSDRVFACNGCHVLDPRGNAELGVARPGFFGTIGRSTFDFEPQMMKIPHFRNLYQKVGMFGMAPTSKLLPDTPDGDNLFMGDQIRGFGFLHDGSTDTPLRFLTTVLFRFVPPSPGDPGNPGGFSLDRATGDVERRNVADFLLAYDSNMAPAVGQQITLSRRDWDRAQPRIDLLERRAVAGECELVVRQSSRGGYLYVPSTGRFRTNRSGAPSLSDAALRQLARRPEAPLTFTCVPPGEGVRVALDRDIDGVLDADHAGRDRDDDLTSP